MEHSFMFIFLLKCIKLAAFESEDEYLNQLLREFGELTFMEENQFISENIHNKSDIALVILNDLNIFPGLFKLDLLKEYVNKYEKVTFREKGTSNLQKNILLDFIIETANKIDELFSESGCDIVFENSKKKESFDIIKVQEKLKDKNIDFEIKNIIEFLYIFVEFIPQKLFLQINTILEDTYYELIREEPDRTFEEKKLLRGIISETLFKNVSSEISKNTKIKAANDADEVKKSDSEVQKCKLHPPAISLPSSSYTTITPPPPSQTCSKMQNSGLDT
ncbi:hypothetical protein CWI36_0657p0010, partial [Hamiltosporidium magnivora]